MDRRRTAHPRDHASGPRQLSESPKFEAAVTTPILATFVFYLGVTLTLGFVAYRATRNFLDYILGGRRLGGAVTALSAGAYLNWQFVAARLRRYTEIAGNSLTIPEFLENRFRAPSRALRVLSAVVILFFFTIYTSAGLVAGGILFESTFGLDYRTALWIGTLVIVCYTFLGGFLAVSWTDFVQGSLMFVALIVIPLVAINDLGGWTALLDSIAKVAPAHLDAFAGLSPLMIASLMAWGLGYFGQPHILARFMAIRSVAQIPKTRLIGIWWMSLSLYGAVLTGVVAVAYFATPLENPETAFIALVGALFNPWIAGCLLAAVLAAIMSTVDSQILVSTSALTQDLYKGFLRQHASDRELLWLGRVGVIVIALIAGTIALDPGNTVLGLVAYAWAGFGAGFGPVVILSLLWPRMTYRGAFAGMAAGVVTVILWARLTGGVFDVYEILTGFLTAAIAVFIVSLLDEPPPPSVRADFERV